MIQRVISKVLQRVVLMGVDGEDGLVGDAGSGVEGDAESGEEGDADDGV